MTIKTGNYSVELGDDSGENALVFIGSFGQDMHIHITAIGTACDGGWVEDFTVPKTRVPADDFKTWVGETLDKWDVPLSDRTRAIRTINNHFNPKFL